MAGGLIVFILITLRLWHAAHRIFKTPHDVGIPPGPTAEMLRYGTALAATAVTATCVPAVG